MSEKEKEIIKAISEVIPKMSEFDKGYWLGRADEMVSSKKSKSEKAG